MYLNSLSQSAVTTLAVTSRNVTNARLAMQGRTSALELFEAESLEIPLYLSGLAVGCAERVNHSCLARESKEYRKFMHVLGFTLFAISYANCCRLPRIDQTDLEAEIEKLGGSDYRTGEFRRRFDQLQSPDFLFAFDSEILPLSDYSQRVLMAIACVVVDAICKDTKHRLSVSPCDLDFADGNGNGGIIDAIDSLNRNSESFVLWMHGSIDDCICAFFGDRNSDSEAERTTYIEILNFFLKAIWSANGLRLPRLTTTFEPRLRNMGEEGLLWKRLGSYFNPIVSDDFLALLYAKTRLLHDFSVCHLLNVASMVMNAWLREESSKML